MSQTVLEFASHLSTALCLGAVVGLERQWRQRMAGTRTHALVAAGAAAFVMAGTAIGVDPTAAGRVASYVVSGVGFLGAGVIFKDGANVRGLNTAATIWCSAAIGVLAGFGFWQCAVLLAIVVPLTNTALRPLATWLHPTLSLGAAETLYEIVLTCRLSDETRLRALLLTTITQTRAALQAIHSEDGQELELTRIRADLHTHDREHEQVEQIAIRLSMEPGVLSLTWSVVPTGVE